MSFVNKVLSIILLINLCVASVYADKGEVVRVRDDYFIIEVGCSYTVAECWSTLTPSKGDKLVGDLKSFGFKDIYNKTRDSEIHIYIEDYLLDEDDALEKLYEL
jgi:hypothetical protein